VYIYTHELWRSNTCHGKRLSYTRSKLRIITDRCEHPRTKYPKTALTWDRIETDNLSTAAQTHEISAAQEGPRSTLFQRTRRKFHGVQPGSTESQQHPPFFRGKTETFCCARVALEPGAYSASMLLYAHVQAIYKEREVLNGTQWKPLACCCK